MCLEALKLGGRLSEGLVGMLTSVVALGLKALVPFCPAAAEAAILERLWEVFRSRHSVLDYRQIRIQVNEFLCMRGEALVVVTIKLLREEEFNKPVPKAESCL